MGAAKAGCQSSDRVSLEPHAEMELERLVAAWRTDQIITHINNKPRLLLSEKGVKERPKVKSRTLCYGIGIGDTDINVCFNI